MSPDNPELVSNVGCRVHREVFTDGKRGVALRATGSISRTRAKSQIPCAGHVCQQN